MLETFFLGNYILLLANKTSITISYSQIFVLYFMEEFLCQPGVIFGIMGL